MIGREKEKRKLSFSLLTFGCFSIRFGAQEMTVSFLRLEVEMARTHEWRVLVGEAARRAREASE
jgi:hypothetical protein